VLQTRAEPSAPPLISLVPSREKARLDTVSVWPARSVKVAPAPPTNQIRAVWSRLPVATNPLRAYATLTSRLRWPPIAMPSPVWTLQMRPFPSLPTLTTREPSAL